MVNQKSKTAVLEAIKQIWEDEEKKATIEDINEKVERGTETIRNTKNELEQENKIQIDTKSEEKGKEFFMPQEAYRESEITKAIEKLRKALKPVRNEPTKQEIIYESGISELEFSKHGLEECKKINCRPEDSADNSEMIDFLKSIIALEYCKPVIESHPRHENYIIPSKAEEYSDYIERNSKFLDDIELREEEYEEGRRVIANLPDVFKNICQESELFLYPEPRLWDSSLISSREVSPFSID